MYEIRCPVTAVIPGNVNHLLSDRQNECFNVGVCSWSCLCARRSVESALWGRTLQTTEGFVKHIRLDVSCKSAKSIYLYYYFSDKLHHSSKLSAPLKSVFICMCVRACVFTGLSKVGEDGG